MPNDNSTIIGVCNYTEITNSKCHLGYSIAKEYEGQGLMCEALLRTNQYIFDKTEINIIQASIIINNHK